MDLFDKIEEGVEFAEDENIPIPRMKSGQYPILTDSQNWGNGKILLDVGIYAGSTE